MRAGDGFWRWCGIPVVLVLLVFSGLNALWNHRELHFAPAEYLPYWLIVYLVGGSGLALVLIWRSVRARRIDRRDLGLEPATWIAPRRLIGVAGIVLVAYGGFVTIERQPAKDTTLAAAATAGTAPQTARSAPQPTWGDYCFWFVILLSASQAELLVFVGVAYCLTERWLRQKGVGRVLSVVLAAPLPCVAFGLYHLSHEPRWYAYVVPLTWEMLIVLAFFVTTRSFYLTLALHNAFAAIGFTTEQYLSADPLPQSFFSEPSALVMNLTAFLLPFLALHLLEWKGWPKPGSS